MSLEAMAHYRVSTQRMECNLVEDGVTVLSDNDDVLVQGFDV